MNFEEYQKETRSTISPLANTPRERMANFALGLTGEAGEVAEAVKKHLYHGKPLPHEHMVEELGDILWYVAAMADLYDVDLGYIAEENLRKLRLRHPNGFQVPARAPGLLDSLPDPAATSV